jgi:hypothetical protein
VTGGNVTVTIDGVDYAADVVDGVAIVGLSDMLPGNYSTRVTYIDENGTASVVDMTLEVPKWDSMVTVTVQDGIDRFDQVIGIEVAPGDATGFVFVDVDGKGYYVNLTDGKANLTVSGLGEGSHTVTVTYPGDSHYANFTETQNFTMAKAIEIEVNGTGNETVVEITVPGNETAGNVA